MIWPWVTWFWNFHKLCGRDVWTCVPRHRFYISAKNLRGCSNGPPARRGLMLIRATYVTRAQLQTVFFFFFADNSRLKRNRTLGTASLCSSHHTDWLRHDLFCNASFGNTKIKKNRMYLCSSTRRATQGVSLDSCAKCCWSSLLVLLCYLTQPRRWISILDGCTVVRRYFKSCNDWDY